MGDEFDICWDVKATKQLKQIHDYFEENYSKQAAKKIINEIISKIDDLRTMPERYSREPLLAHKKENFRYFIVRSFKIIYEVTPNEVLILLIHNIRQNPSKIKEVLD